MISELDTVVLTKNLPENNLSAGDVGTVVHSYESDKAFEVEFVTGSGETIAVITVESDHVRLLGQGDILHIRDLAA